MREAWEGGRSVPESSAGEAAVVKRAPVHHQDGSALPRRGVSTWSSRNAAVFLSCRSTTTSDRKKLFVVRCAIANSIELRRALARWTERAVGNRVKRVI